MSLIELLSYVNLNFGSVSLEVATSVGGATELNLIVGFDVGGIGWTVRNFFVRGSTFEEAVERLSFRMITLD